MNQNFVVGISANPAGLVSGLSTGTSALNSFASNAAAQSARFGGSMVQGFGQGAAAAQNFAQQAQQSGAILSVAFSAPLALLGKTAISTYADMDSLRRGLATLEKDGGALQSRMTALAEVAKLPGLGKKEAIEFDIALRSAGIGADLSKKAMMAFGNALGSVGKGKNELKGVSAQLQQLATKTGGFGADIKVIKEYAPQVGAALMSAFGTVDTDAIAKTGVTGKQVIAKIVDELAKLPAATGGAKNGFENFGDSATSAFDAIGESLFKGLHVEAVLNTIAGAVGALVEKFKALPATTQTVIVSVIALAVAIPPLIAAIGFFTTTILPALRAGMAATRVAALAMAGPFGLIALAIGVAALLIITHWDKVKKFLVDTGVWQVLKDVVRAALGIVTSLFGIFANLFQGDWAALWEHTKNVFKYLWNGILSIFVAGTSLIPRLLAKLASSLGFDELAKKINSGTDAYAEFLNGLKATVPEPKFNLFDGFNFGGQSEVADGKGKEKKKKKEAAEPGQASDYDERTATYLQKLKVELKDIQKYVDETRALGVPIKPGTIEHLQEVESQIKKIENAIKAAEVKPIEYRPIVSTPDFVKRNGPQDAGNSVSHITARADVGINIGSAVEGAKQQLGTAMAGMPDFIKNIGAGLTAAAEGAISKGAIAGPFIEAIDALGTAMNNAKQVLKDGAVNLMVGIGEAIGSGKNPLKAALKIILDILGDYLIRLGLGMLAAAKVTALAAAFIAAVGGPAAIPLAAQSTGSTLAAGALIVGGGIVKGFASAFANGGLVTGPVMGLVGEGRGTTRSNPEVISPLDKLKTLIGDSGNSGMGTITTRVSGSDLLILMERATDSRQNLRGY